MRVNEVEVNYKYDHVLDRIQDMHIHAYRILLTTTYFFHKLGKEFTLTETVTSHAEDTKLRRRSAAHRQGRAFDVRAKHLSPDEQEQVVDFLNEEFSDYAYISSSGAKRVCLLHGKGDNIHFHVAIHSRYALPEIGYGAH